jgi:hypothetical protein
MQARSWSSIFVIAVFEISWIVDLNVSSSLCTRELLDVPAVSCQTLDRTVSFVSELAAVCVTESAVGCQSCRGSTVLCVAMKRLALL